MVRTAGSNAPESRARILDAAIGLFRERGYAGTSIRDLAERAHMTTSTMYYHFEGKDQILSALFDPCLAAFRDIAALPSDSDMAVPPGDGDVAALPSTEAQREILEQLLELFAGQGPSIQAVMNDQSAMRYVREHTDFPVVMVGLERKLAGGDDPADLIRARCALGALQRGVTALTADSQPGDSNREIVLVAALAALRSRPYPDRA